MGLGQGPNRWFDPFVVPPPRSTQAKGILDGEQNSVIVTRFIPIVGGGGSVGVALNQTQRVGGTLWYNLLKTKKKGE